jgi:tetratricopeptide (TPR) repeat protein
MRLDLPPQITSFIEEKERHAQSLTKKLKVKVHDDYWTYFRQARSGDWPAAERTFESLRKRACPDEGSKRDPRFDRAVWQTIAEVSMVLDAYTPTNNAPKWSTAFGEGVVKSIPRGSIYFGGTGPGRGLPTAFSKSHADGDPFFTLTQNALADGHYLEYIRETYGGKIQIPSNEDSQRCFQEYLADAQKRLEHDRKSPNEPRQLRPGEDVGIVDNKVQVSGQVAHMAINGLLTKVVFDNNRGREFYIQENLPLDWMYPYLAPLPSLSPEVVSQDHEFWTKQQVAMIGGWLKIETPLQEVCDFAEKVFLDGNLDGFQGDPAFVRSDYTTRMYSRLRGSIGGVYNWRIANSKSPEEQQRMIQEADFAFRQSFAFCPDCPEAIYRYVNLLVQLGRIDDALLVVRTAVRLNPKDAQHQNIIAELERIRSAQPK